MGESIWWVDADGGTLKLYDSGDNFFNPAVKYSVLKGLEGLQIPQYAFSTERVYTYDGEVLRQIQTQARKPILPLLVKGRSAQEFLENQRLLLHAMNPLRGDGALKVYTVDGETRILTCRLFDAPIKEGFDTGLFRPPFSARKGPTTQWRMFPVTFIATDPYWYDPLEQEINLSNENPATNCYTLNDLSYPIVCNNEGDVDTWPIWSITPDVALDKTTTTFTIRIINLTTGKFLLMALAVDGGSRIFIDTRPLIHTVLLDHTVNKFNSLSTDSSPFPLVPGPNRIRFAVAGTPSLPTPSGCNTHTTTAVRVRWVNRYQGL